jgi:hypothetical protein
LDIVIFNMVCFCDCECNGISEWRDGNLNMSDDVLRINEEKRMGEMEIYPQIVKWKFFVQKNL